jgi:putative zinc finger/helix-turn-helix YgiT family protein
MKTKRARVKPFPWKCRNCGKIAVRSAIVSYAVELEYDGRTYKFTVDGLKSPQCQECQEIFPDAEANRQISTAFHSYAKLLTPQQIRRNREALGLTQREMATLLGVAEASISRWETGAQIQQRSLDRLLRICFASPSIRTVLADEHFLAQFGAAAILSQTGQTIGTPVVHIKTTAGIGVSSVAPMNTLFIHKSPVEDTSYPSVPLAESRFLECSYLQGINITPARGR